MIQILSLFSSWKVKLAVIAVIILGLYFWHRSEVKIAVNQAVQEIKYESAKENFKLQENALNSKIALQDNFDKIQKDKDAKIKTLNADVSNLRNSLRNRPYRTEGSDLSRDTRTEESTTGATGLRLYRSDAEVLVWFAGETTELQTELKACYASYDKARETLKKFKDENSPKTE